MDNIFSDFLGIDLLEAQKVSQETLEKRKEVAVAIVKLTEYPEWQVFTSELERMLKSIDKDCDYYALYPEQAKYDSGMKRSVVLIKRFIDNQSKILDEYGKEKQNQEQR